MTGAPVDTLTHVELIWLEKRIEHWIQFGHDVAEQILDRRRRILSFAPGTLFGLCVLRRERLRHRRLSDRHPARRRARRSVLDVPYVRPGGEILLRLSDWPKVEAVDAIEHLCIDPAHACTHHLASSYTAASCPAKTHGLTPGSALARWFCGEGSARDAVRLGHGHARRGARGPR